MRKRMAFIALSAIIFLLGLQCTVSAQITLTGQLRTRTELRNGYGNLLLIGTKPAAFTSQRTRLIFGYKWDRLSFGATLQDVRVWGQDASTISSADGAKLGLHEAWADLTLANKADTTIKFKMFDLMSLKIGRQELIYDDSRLIGNADWLQQARRHDMALLKTVHRGWQVDIGYAYNQSAENLSSTSYLAANVPVYVTNSLGTLVATPAGMLPLAPGGSLAKNSSKTGTGVWLNPPGTNAATQEYKSFTSVYISKKFNQTKFSALFFNDNFGKSKLDSAGSVAAGYVYGKRFVASSAADPFDYSGANRRYTYGLMVNHTIGNASGFGKIAIQAAYYGQSGQNREGITMNNAYHYTIAVTYQKEDWSFTPGYDVLSGNNSIAVGGPALTVDNRFDPLYGTPHKFWGYMDYFYAGSGAPAEGLQDAYFKVKYAGNALAVGLDYHYFAMQNSLQKSVGGAFVDKGLGSELNLIANYNMNKFTNVELGYSTMFATSSMPWAKGQATTDAVAATYRTEANWFYVMFKFTPDFFYTKPVAIKQP
jgi:hypothetical protein